MAQKNVKKLSFPFWVSMHSKLWEGSLASHINPLVSHNKEEGRDCSVKIQILLTSEAFSNPVNFGIEEFRVLF